MSHSKWAAIIYGRTYDVDFRLIVRPEDFGTDEINWAKSHILVTTRWSEKLRDCYRWSIFKNDRHCIVGLTCMAAALSKDMVDDWLGRPLFVFVGYVAQEPFPAFFPMELELFKPIYNEYVGRRWYEKSHQTRKADLISKSEYQQLDYSERVDFPAYNPISSSQLNINSEKICLWPDLDEYKQQLWLATFSYKKPISLCLGLARQNDAIEGPFLNATAFDVTERSELLKHQKNTVEHQETTPSLSTEKSDSLQEQDIPMTPEDTIYSQETSTPQSSINKFPEKLLETVIDGITGLASLFRFNDHKKNQDSQQSTSKSHKNPEFKNQKEQSLIPDPLSEQRDINSMFFKPKKQQESQEENQFRQDDSDGR